MKTTSAVKSLHEHIIALAKNSPKDKALLSCNEKGEILEEITFAELSERIESAGNYLAGLSLKSGDRVALAFGNSAELLILSWASWGMGVVTVPLDIKR